MSGAKQIEQTPNGSIPHSDSPATLGLGSSLSQPAVVESSVLAEKLRVERERAWGQIGLIDAESEALQSRRNDLTSIVAACEAGLSMLGAGQNPSQEESRNEN